MEMKIHLPDEIAEYDGELRFFFDLMVRKLHLNRHKGWGGGHPASNLMEGLRKEVEELALALAEESQFEAAIEAADVANMALLTALVVMRQSKKEFEDGRT